MERSPQGDQDQGPARAVVNAWLFSIRSQGRLSIAEQAVKQVIEFGVAVELVEEIVEVQKNCRITVLPIVCEILVERLQSGSRKRSGSQVSHRPEEVRREIAQLHDLAGIITKAKLRGCQARGLRMPKAVKTRSRGDKHCPHHKQHKKFSQHDWVLTCSVAKSKPTTLHYAQRAGFGMETQRSKSQNQKD